jgi:hypothetical protein
MWIAAFTRQMVARRRGSSRLWDRGDAFGPPAGEENAVEGAVKRARGHTGLGRHDQGASRGEAGGGDPGVGKGAALKAGRNGARRRRRMVPYVADEHV